MSADAFESLSAWENRSATLEHLRTTFRLLGSHPHWGVRHALARAMNVPCVCPQCHPRGNRCVEAAP
jgi:hypothetical protein